MKTRAFWKYDLFPYLLHSPVRSEATNGRVVVDGFGGGIQVKPLHLIPGNHGAAVAGELDAITTEYNAKADELKANYMQRVAALFEA